MDDVEINDIRTKKDFRGITFSKYKKSEVHKELLKNLYDGKIEKVSYKLLVKYFTAAELEALADYYSSPLAQSAHKKMGAYSAELVPVIQAEASKAIAEMQKAEMEKNRSLPDVQE